MNSIFYNGRMLPANEPVLKAGNRAFQYGDGLFETMRVHNGKIILADFHFHRLKWGMQVMMMIETFYDFDTDVLQDAILQLCQENKHLPSARVRLTVFRKDLPTGNEFDQPGILIETWPLENGYIFNTQPFTVDVFTDARKCADMISPFKTTSRLPYALAAVFARQQQLDDALVITPDGNICDSSIANVYVVKDGVIYTPHTTEGPIAGVMRRHTFENIGQTGIKFKWASINIDALLSADEVFLTNVIRGIQPVTRFREANYTINLSRKLFDSLIKPLTLVEQSAP